MKVSVRASEVLKDLRIGMSNEDLMGKYGLSQKGLDSLFRKLVGVGLVDEEELEHCLSEDDKDGERPKDRKGRDEL